MASDNFTGSATTLAAHDSNWALARVSDGEALSDLRIDGSGFCIMNNGFGTGRTFYTGTTEAAKSEVVIPQNAFSSANAGDVVGAFVCGGTTTGGLNAHVRQADLTAQDFAGNGTDPSNTYAPPDNCNFVAFHDDEYIAGLRSGTGFPALAELCNNATYASATVIRQCEIVSISGTTWQVKINMPFAAFGVTDATGLYLALYDSAGSRTMVAV